MKTQWPWVTWISKSWASPEQKWPWGHSSSILSLLHQVWCQCGLMAGLWLQQGLAFETQPLGNQWLTEIEALESSTGDCLMCLPADFLATFSPRHSAFPLGKNPPIRPWFRINLYIWHCCLVCDSDNVRYLTGIPGVFKSLSQRATNPKSPLSALVALLLLVLNPVFLNHEWGLLQRLEEPFGFVANSFGLLIQREFSQAVWKTMRKTSLKEWKTLQVCIGQTCLPFLYNLNWISVIKSDFWRLERRYLLITCSQSVRDLLQNWEQVWVTSKKSVLVYN